MRTLDIHNPRQVVIYLASAITALIVVLLFLNMRMNMDIERDRFVTKWDSLNIKEFNYNPYNPNVGFAGSENAPFIGVYKKDPDTKEIMVLDSNVFDIKFTDTSITGLSYSVMQYGNDVHMIMCVIDFSSESEAKAYASTYYKETGKGIGTKAKRVDTTKSGMQQKLAVYEKTDKTMFLAFYQDGNKMLIISGNYKDDKHIKGAFKKMLGRKYLNPTDVE